MDKEDGSGRRRWIAVWTGQDGCEGGSVNAIGCVSREDVGRCLTFSDRRA